VCFYVQLLLYRRLEFVGLSVRYSIRDIAVVLASFGIFMYFVYLSYLTLPYLLSYCNFKVECFPTPVRTSAMGVLAAGGRLGAMSAQFVNGSLESNVPLLLFITSACSIVGGLCAWLLPFDPVGTSMSVDMPVDSRQNNRSSSNTLGDNDVNFAPTE
jgi:hypothetical protein